MATKKEPGVQFERQDFDLFKALEALDRKDYGYLDSMTEEQQRKFVPYMMVHWMSAVKAKSLLQGYYVISTDSSANKYMFNEYVSKHPKLQWMMLCAASPGMGKQFHQWIPHLSTGVANLKEKAKAKDVAEYFKKIYPGTSNGAIAEVAEEWTAAQHHRHRLAKMYPELKISDIEVLSSIVSSSDLDEYDRKSGN